MCCEWDVLWTFKAKLFATLFISHWGFFLFHWGDLGGAAGARPLRAKASSF